MRDSERDRRYGDVHDPVTPFRPAAKVHPPLYQFDRAAQRDIAKELHRYGQAWPGQCRENRQNTERQRMASESRFDEHPHAPRREGEVEHEGK